MVGIKTGKQINKRLHRKNSKKYFQVLFCNRRGLKVLTSRSPIETMYIKMPFVGDYTEREEKMITDFLNKKSDKR